MNFGPNQLDKPGLMAIFLSRQPQVGTAQMRDRSFHNLSNINPLQSDALPPCACLLGREDTSELSLAAKSAGQINLIECDSMNEVIALISSKNVSIAIVDVDLSDQWPQVEADRLCDVATDDTSIVIVCNGSEADGSLIQLRCQSNSNVIVVMGKRCPVNELLKLCIAAFKLKKAQPRMALS